MTDTFSSAGWVVQYTARAQQELLFTVRVGFRPQKVKVRAVEGRPVADGITDPAALIPVRFRVQIAPSDAVRDIDGPELDEVVT